MYNIERSHDESGTGCFSELSYEVEYLNRLLIMEYSKYKLKTMVFPTKRGKGAPDLDSIEVKSLLFNLGKLNKLSYLF